MLGTGGAGTSRGYCVADGQQMSAVGINCIHLVG